MRITVLVLFVMLAGACAPSQHLQREPGKVTKVALSVEAMTIHSSTAVFSEQTGQNVLETGFVDSVGNDILEKVLSGYKNFTKGFEYTGNADEADFKIRVQHLEVERRFITLNIPHPGPIYKVTMNAEVFNKDSLFQSLSYSGRANMAQVNFSDETVHWMNSEETLNQGYQIKTLDKALRNIYQQLYFNLFDIRL